MMKMEATQASKENKLESWKVAHTCEPRKGRRIRSLDYPWLLSIEFKASLRSCLKANKKQSIDD